MPLVKDGKEIKVKKKMLAKITVVRISVLVILIIIPIYLLGLIKVFYEGGDRLPEKTSCAVVIMPDYGTGAKPSFYFEKAVETAIHLKDKAMVGSIIFTGCEGRFGDKETAAVREKLETTPVRDLYPEDLVFTKPMKDYEEMALTIESTMAKNNMYSASLIDISYYMAKTMLYFERANKQTDSSLTFKGYPLIVDERYKKEAEDWWYIYREALYYIYYYLFAQPGKESA